VTSDDSRTDTLMTNSSLYYSVGHVYQLQRLARFFDTRNKPITCMFVSSHSLSIFRALARDVKMRRQRVSE